MIKKLVKIIAWLIGGAIGLVALSYIGLLAINWRDASPSEETTRFTQIYSKHSRVADEQNAFVYLVGMSVVPAYDPMKAGMAMVERNRADIPGHEPNGYSHPDYPQMDFIKGRSKTFTEIRDICISPDEKCMALMTNANHFMIERTMNDNLLLERYRTMVAFPAWQDIHSQGIMSPIPSYAVAMDGQLFSMLDIVQQAGKRSAAETIELLDRDARFWREVLVSSDSLLTSMMAAASLKRNLFWTNLVLKQLSDRKAICEPPPTWLTPISDEERLLARAWVGEWEMFEPTMRQLPQQIQKEQESRDGEISLGERIVTRLMLPFYQPQDSINRHTHDFATLISEYDVPYEQLPGVAAKQHVLSDEPGDEAMTFPYILYNPTGKILNSIAKPDYGSYMLRLPDLEGGRRALLATHQLRAEKTPRGKVGEALAASTYRNPYTNLPFNWNETLGSVGFEGLGEGKHKHYVFPY